MCPGIILYPAKQNSGEPHKATDKVLWLIGRAQRSLLPHLQDQQLHRRDLDEVTCYIFGIILLTTSFPETLSRGCRLIYGAIRGPRRNAEFTCNLPEFLL